jgi:hypothetical protein
MNPTQPVNLSVTDPLDKAWARMKLVLFQPWDAGKWFVIGFCAWLAQLGQHGFSNPGGAFNVGSGNSHQSGVQAREGFEQAREYVTSNLYWLGPIILAVVIFGIGLWVVITWLNSRGQFMFLHCVSRNVAEVAVPWREYARQGNSLCLFRLALGIVGLLAIGTLVALLVVAIIGMVSAGRPDVGGIALAVGSFLTLLVLGLTFFLIGKLTTDFVVPIMLVRRCRCLAGWRELIRLFSGHLGHLLLYLLFQIVIAIIISSIVLVVILITCCLAGCLMALPYLGTVLMLPVLIFVRAYSAYYLAQFGREYDVFAEALNESGATEYV